MSEDPRNLMSPANNIPNDALAEIAQNIILTTIGRARDHREQTPNRLHMIRDYRNAVNCGLLEAKNMIEKHLAILGYAWRSYANVPCSHCDGKGTVAELEKFPTVHTYREWEQPD